MHSRPVMTPMRPFRNNAEYTKSIERLFMFDVMAAIAGRVHADQAVEPVDGCVSQTDLLIGHAQALKFIQHQAQTALFDAPLRSLAG